MKGNLVAVVSNGTAILGLGDRGALAGKPVMEGKGVLFKKFAAHLKEAFPLITTLFLLLEKDKCRLVDCTSIHYTEIM